MRLSIRRVAVLLVAVSLVAAACGGDDDDAAESSATTADQTTVSTSVPAAESETDDSAESPDTTEASEPVESDGVVDLTGQILTATEADCAFYSGDYTSMITDIPSGQDFEGMFAISTAGDTCVFDTNQIPNHNTGENSNFATPVDEVDATLEITMSPELADNPTALDMGASVLMLNGVKWEAYPAACFGVGDEPEGREAIGCFDDQIENPWRYNIGSPLNDFGFDDYLAHVQPGGLYHYHSTPSVLYDIECEGTAVSPVVGFAADGFPVYGPCFQDEDGTIRAAESSYVVRDGARQDVEGYTTPYVVGNVMSDEYDGQFIGDHEYVEGGGDLDECNGMTVDGQYGYYITGSYPYVLSCYSGTASASFR